MMSTSVAMPRKWRRTHGLQPPLHPQQAAACLFLALFALLNFGMLLPALHSSIFLYVVSTDRMLLDGATGLNTGNGVAVICIPPA